MFVLRTERDDDVLPSTRQVDTHTGHCLWFVLETHGCKQQTVVCHEVRDLSYVTGHFHKLGPLQEVVVRMVNGYLKP